VPRRVSILRRRLAGQRVRLLLALLALLPVALTPGCAHRGAGPLLAVDTLAVTRATDGSCRFNGDRRYVVGFHRLLSDTGIDRRLGRRLAGSALADQVVVQWFGEEDPDRVELILGRDLPVSLAAELVELTAQLSPLPVAVSGTDADDAVCQRAQAYVGAVLPTLTSVWSAPQLDSLVRHADDPDAFWARVPASGR